MTPNSPAPGELAPARQGNLSLGILAGAGAAIAGALVWMGIALLMNMHLGLIAIAIGALVGFSIRTVGRGSDIAFGIAGAVLTLLSCLCGEVLAAIAIAATHGIDEQAPAGFAAVLQNVDLIALVSAILAHTDAMGYIIYAIGIYEGYKFSMVK